MNDQGGYIGLRVRQDGIDDPANQTWKSPDSHGFGPSVSLGLHWHDLHAQGALQIHKSGA